MSTFPSYQDGETPWIRVKSLRRVKEDTLVTSLLPGESIAYTITDQAGVVVGSGDNTSRVTHWAGGTWGALATKTPSNAALDTGRYAVRWTLTVGGGTAIEDDAFDIKP
jgi:hypothetical protein